MKKTLRSLSTIVVVLLISNRVNAQDWSFGPRVNVGLSSNRTTGERVEVGSTTISTNDYGDAVGTSFGAFARYDRPRWYAQAELGRGKFSLANVNVEGEGGGAPLYPYARRTDARLLVGLKLLPWLRLNTGLVAVRNNWKVGDYSLETRYAQEYIQRYPAEEERYRRVIEKYNVSESVERSFSRNNLEMQAGVGADIGGLTVDLTYSAGLNPVLDRVQFQNQTYAIRQRYGFLSMSIGYRLLPLKSHLLAPRRNRAYERIQRDIPFYRNEFHVSGGLLAEDIGSAFLYENRYTRYLMRRVGFSAGLNLMRAYETYNSGFLPKQFTQAQLVTGFRVLPLYSRRHTIGLSVGPVLTYTSGFRPYSGGSQTINGQLFQTVDITSASAMRKLSATVQGTFDYNFAATDRVILGPWLRVMPDNAYFGIQAGYRF